MPFYDLKIPLPESNRSKTLIKVLHFLIKCTKCVYIKSSKTCIMFMFMASETVINHILLHEAGV